MSELLRRSARILEKQGQETPKNAPPGIRFLKDQILVLKSPSLYKLALVSHDVPENSESILINLLEEKGDELTYSVAEQTNVKLEDVLQTIQMQREGTYYKMSQRQLISINLLFQSSSEDEEDGDIEVPLKRKEPKQIKTPTKKQKIAKQSNAYKRGVINPNVKASQINELLTDPHEFGNFDISLRINNLNFHRAALGKNNQLLDNLLKSKNRISNLMESWGPECKVTCLDRAILCENEYFVQEMYKALSSNILVRAVETVSELSFINTGAVSVQAYGVQTREVKVSRGGREGNNALLCKSSMTDNLTSITSTSFLKNLIEKSVSVSMLKLLLTVHPLVGTNLGFCIGDAIRTGDQDLALFMISYFNQKGGFGLNFLHEQVLQPGPLSPFKGPSVTKKPVENYLVAPLHVACINQDPSHLRSLLSCCDDINYTDKEGRKVVHYAASNVSSECLKVLKEHGCNFNELDQAKISPLMVAAMYNRAESAAFLTEQMVPLHMKAKDGRAAIHFAAENGCLQVFKVLVDAGCRLDQPGTDRKTPLMFAAINGHYEIVLEILNRKGKDTKKDKCRRSALIWAVKNGHSDVVSLLLSRGSPFDEPDSSKNFPIHYAAAYGWMNCLLLLIQAGADVNVTNDWNISPLLIASLKGQEGCFKYLLESTQADVNIKDEQGRTLISRAIIQLNSDNFDQVSYLVAVKKADVNIRDLSGLSPLHHLCNKSVSVPWVQGQTVQEREQLQQQQKEVILRTANLLIDYGAEISPGCNAGTTPVLYSIKSKNLMMTELLIKKGADLTICPYTGGVFHYLLCCELELFVLCARVVEDQINVNALDSQRRTLVSKMVDVLNADIFDRLNHFISLKKADLNIVDVNGLNPLHYLCKKNRNPTFSQNLNENEKKEILEKHIELMEMTAKLFIEAGCDFNARCKFGSSPILYAIKMNNIGLAKYLVEIGADLTNFPSGGGIFHYLPSFESENLNFCESLLDSLIENDNSLVVLDDQGFSAFLRFVEFYSANYSRPRADYSFISDINMRTSYFIKILAKMISKGSDPHAEVKTLKQYREPELTNCTTDSDYLASLHQYSPKGKFSALHLSSGCNDLVLFEFLLNLKLDINHQDYLRNTLIMNSYLANSVFTEKLIDLGAELDTQNHTGDTLIHRAVEKLDFQMIQTLLAKGVNTNIRGATGKTILSIAVGKNNLDLVRNLLDHGANPNIPDDNGLTPLHLAFIQADASANASFDMESLLLLFNADINSTDCKKRTPLHYSFIKLIERNENLLVDPIEAVSSACAVESINVNIQDDLGRTPLHYAAQRGAITSTMFLLAKGADLEVEDIQGNTPLAVSIRGGHANYAITLVQQSANVNKNIFVKEASSLYSYTIKGDQHFLISNNQNLEAGTLSMFKAAIMQNFQGLAYLLLFNGYPYMLAMQDAITQRMFPLVKTLLAKVSRNAELQKSNENLQNLIHSLAQYSGQAKIDLINQIFNQLIDRGVDIHQLDAFQRNPLHYSSMVGNLAFSEILLARRVSFSTDDSDGMNPVAYAVQGGKIMSSLASLQLFASYGASFQFKYNEGGVIQSPLLHAIKSGAPLAVITLMLKHGATLQDTGSIINPVIYAINGPRICSSLQILEILAAHGADFSCKFEENGVVVTPLVHAIKSNASIDVIWFLLSHGSSLTETDSLGKSGFLYSVISKRHSIVRALINEQSLDLSQVDSEGKTALMYAVLANDFQITKTILNSKSFRPAHLAQVDQIGKHVLHYVVQPFPYGSYENKEMLELILPLHPQPLLEDLTGENILTLAAKQRSGAFSKIISQHFPDLVNHTVERKLSSYQESLIQTDYINDAEEYIKTQSHAEQPHSIAREPDTNGQFPAYYQVFEDYDLIMTKIDISFGPYSAVVFYRMQILLDTNRTIYVLYTRWGRIGEVGASQRTPFSEKEEAIKEFCKIFKAKSGNEWGSSFEKHKGKYLLSTFRKTKAKYKDFICEFDPDAIAETSIKQEVIQAVKEFTCQRMFKSYFNTMRIDSQLMNFSNISRSSVLEAEQTLIRLSELIKDFQSENEVDRKIELISNIQESTSRFYELIPVSLDQHSAIAPIMNQNDLNSLRETVLILKDLELASKIILGALYRQKEVSPYEYVLSSLQINLDLIESCSDEFQMIQKYMSKGQARAHIFSLFKVNRKDESERIEEFKDVAHRKLLWHGTKSINLMTILARGLKIAPPEAPVTGYMFGKGVYFADSFDKSFGYCDQTYSRTSFMLLCEVVLGNMYELSNAQYIEQLPDGFLSTKGVGSQSPDPEQSITTPYGVEIPLGDLKSTNTFSYNLRYNEYIVYKTSQIRIRYLLHLRSY